MTAVAALIMVLSTLLIAANLPGLARDAAWTLRASAAELVRAGRLAPNLAFLCLWLLIFGFCNV